MNRRNRCRRRGGVLIFALVCLALAVIMMGVVARVALMGGKQTRDEGCRIQTAWLVESAFERAAASLAVEPDYKGEMWKIPAEIFGTNHGAEVQIEVETFDPKLRWLNIRVRADFPEGSIHRTRKSKQRSVTLVPREEKEPDNEQGSRKFINPKSQNPNPQNP